VGRSIGSQEKQLEEEHASRPQGRGAAEPWEEVFTENKLYRKKQKRAKEDTEPIRLHCDSFIFH
jgi:hypothetical protein